MLTIQFVPYADMEDLTPEERINKLLMIVKEEKIVVMEGKLSKHEEADLIKATMEQINLKFKGIEISVIHPESKSETFGKKLKYNLATMLIGDRQGLTVIGPATLIKEIKKDPGRVQLFTKEKRKRKK